MTENKGDLISRETLKKAFEEVYPLATNEMGGIVNKRIYDIIDNAPTVERPYDNITEEDIQNAIKAGYENGYSMAQAKYERPQGEWIPNYTSQFMNPGRMCSLCGKIVEFSENYCPNCGAYMRGDNNA